MRLATKRARILTQLLHQAQAIINFAKLSDLSEMALGIEQPKIYSCVFGKPLEQMFRKPGPMTYQPKCDEFFWWQLACSGVRKHRFRKKLSGFLKILLMQFGIGCKSEFFGLPFTDMGMMIRK